MCLSRGERSEQTARVKRSGTFAVARKRAEAEGRGGSGSRARSALLTQGVPGGATRREGEGLLRKQQGEPEAEITADRGRPIHECDSATARQRSGHISEMADRQRR